MKNNSKNIFIQKELRFLVTNFLFSSEKLSFLQAFSLVIYSCGSKDVLKIDHFCTNEGEKHSFLLCSFEKKRRKRKKGTEEFWWNLKMRWFWWKGVSLLKKNLSYLLFIIIFLMRLNWKSNQMMMFLFKENRSFQTTLLMSFQMVKSRIIWLFFEVQNILILFQIEWRKVEEFRPRKSNQIEMKKRGESTKRLRTKKHFLIEIKMRER